MESSGLESIALAVAHLEAQQHHAHQQGASAIPPRTAFSNPRLVSAESIVHFPGETPHNVNMHAEETPAIDHDLPPVEAAQSAIKSLRFLKFPDSVPTKPDPSDIITRVVDHDVLLGRGGETNHNYGNMQYRRIVKVCQPAYIRAKRRDKPKIASLIVRIVRQLGGRFLKRDMLSHTWKDVGDVKAREKTSQALREGAPELRDPGYQKKPRFYVNGVEVPSNEDTSSYELSSPTKQKTEEVCMNSANEAETTPRSVSSYISEGSTVSPSTSFVGNLLDKHDEQMPKKQPRGPRVKLLKRRLDEEHSD